MRSCKEISELISASLDRQLPLGQRIAVIMHLMMCKFCARYRRQTLLLRDAMRHYVEAVEPSEALLSVSLSEEARQRIRRSLLSISDCSI